MYYVLKEKLSFFYKFYNFLLQKLSTIYGGKFFIIIIAIYISANSETMSYTKLVK